MKNQAKFDSMNFGCGGSWHDYFVVNAKKYTREEAIELYKTKGNFHGNSSFRMPTLLDVFAEFVAYRMGVCEDDGEGCYTFVDKGSKGSFPVWVIKYDDLEEPK